MLSGTPAESDVGVTRLTATVTDVDGLSDSQDFEVTVVSEPDPFTLDVGSSDKSVNEGEELRFTASITDNGDPDVVELSASNLPSGASFNAVTQEFSWTPTEALGPDTVTVTLTATNGDFTTSQDVNLTVVEVNQNPVLAEIGSRSVGVGEVVSITVSATDADLPANALTFSADVSNAPFLSFDAASGILSGTPVDTNVGMAQVTVTVDDGLGGMDSETFTIDVTSGPFDLVFSGSTSVDEGSPLSVTASVQDLDGVADNAVLSAENLPSGAAFDAATGVLSWTPSEADGPGTFMVPHLGNRRRF